VHTMHKPTKIGGGRVKGLGDIGVDFPIFDNFFIELREYNLSETHPFHRGSHAIYMEIISTKCVGSNFCKMDWEL
jgi:hypothetical protein